LQSDYHYYFGGNSFFQNQEKYIYDYFNFEEELSDFTFLEGMREQNDLTSFLNVKQTPFCKIVKSLNVEEHLQVGRTIEDWFHRLRKLPTDLTVDQRDEWNDQFLCSIEWVCLHPERFNQQLVRLAMRAKEILEHKDVPDNVTSYYKNVVQDGLTNYAAESRAGGTVTICVRYETEEHLQAMLEVMNPATRYPFNQELPKDRIQHLLFREGNIRVSQGILHSMWKAGTVFDSYEVIDGTTLTCTLRCGLFLFGTMEGISGLGYDARDIGERYKVKKPTRADAIISRAKCATVSAVIEAIDGTWSAGYPLPCIFHEVESRPKLKQLAKSSESPVELALELLHDKHVPLILKE